MEPFGEKEKWHTTVERMVFHQKVKNRTITSSRNSIYGYILKEIEKQGHKEIFVYSFIATLATIAKIWTQSKCPLTDELINKMRHRYM